MKDYFYHKNVSFRVTSSLNSAGLQTHKPKSKKQRIILNFLPISVYRMLCSAAATHLIVAIVVIIHV